MKTDRRQTDESGDQTGAIQESLAGDFKGEEDCVKRKRGMELKHN